MPAYRFVRFDYIPPVGAEPLGRIAEAMRRKEGFFLTASLKQDRKSRGTLLALEGPGATRRQFEIVSNGPADTLDLTYWVDGAQHVISLEDVGLADAQWKNVTVQVTGETYSLYVGCDLMDSFTLDEPFYEQLKTEQSRMYVAKGSARESHFRVGEPAARCQLPSREALGWHTHTRAPSTRPCTHCPPQAPHRARLLALRSPPRAHTHRHTAHTHAHRFLDQAQAEQTATNGPRFPD